MRPAILLFLKNGKQPRPGSSDWLSPDTRIPLAKPNRLEQAPFTSLLIEIALWEKELQEAIRLYDEQPKSKKGSAWIIGLQHNLDNRSLTQSMLDPLTGKRIEAICRRNIKTFSVLSLRSLRLGVGSFSTLHPQRCNAETEFAKEFKG